MPGQSESRRRQPMSFLSGALSPPILPPQFPFKKGIKALQKPRRNVLTVQRQREERESVQRWRKVIVVIVAKMF